jgi:CheY-like chemotaxis protein/DNA-binding CsgD family transcriptional regulator
MQSLSLPSEYVVLVVDDIPDNLLVLHDALDESGYTVLVATSGVQAIERCSQAMPDIVLLDAVMPTMDGFEVARLLKADPRVAHIPIIFMTGLTETEHLVRALDTGAVDYLVKPIKPAEMLARMAVHLQGARLAQQTRLALDAFGCAAISVNLISREVVWQTPLARQLLGQYFGKGQDPVAFKPLFDWLMRASSNAANATAFHVMQGPRKLSFSLQQPTDQEAEWLVVLRETSDASVIQAMAHAFGLTAKESEVLFWVAKGKTNRDIGDIVGSKPLTVKKHLERVFEKLGVETRTAAAALAVRKIRQSHPQFEG